MAGVAVLALPKARATDLQLEKALPISVWVVLQLQEFGVSLPRMPRPLLPSIQSASPSHLISFHSLLGTKEDNEVVPKLSPHFRVQSVLEVQKPTIASRSEEILFCAWPNPSRS